MIQGLKIPLSLKDLAPKPSQDKITPGAARSWLRHKSVLTHLALWNHPGPPRSLAWIWPGVTQSSDFQVTPQTY